MAIRVSYYINEDPKPVGSFNSVEECKNWWRENRLSPYDESRIIKVETDLDALQKSIEQNQKP